MHARLVAADGGEPIPLKKDLTVIGRQRGVCDVLIEQSVVSKVHCLIVKTDGLLLVRDLASTNGTIVNGQRVTRGALLPGDQLAFGSVRFEVQFGARHLDNAERLHEERTEAMLVPPPMLDEDLIGDGLDSDDGIGLLDED